VAAPPAAAAAASGSTRGGGGLATTGADPLALGLGAAGIVALGAGALYVVRRRRAHADA